MAKKTQYGLGHTRITIPNRPDLANKTALIQVGDKTLEEALEEAGGGVSNYQDLENKPSINGVELVGNKTSNDLGVYSKPSGGIPETDLSSDVQQALQKHFKGWYASSSALPDNPVVGDYAYVKGATSTDPAAIYECTTAGSWSDSGRTADTSNVQTFASNQEVNNVHIVNDLTTGGVDDVLSAEQGKVLYDVFDGATIVPEYTLIGGNRNSTNTGWDSPESTRWMHTSPIHVNAGETVYVHNKYTTKYRCLWETDSEGVTYKNISGTNSVSTTYIAPEDMYVVADFDLYGNESYIKIKQVGLVKKVENNADDIADLETRVTIIESVERVLVSGTDYSWLANSYTGVSGTNHTTPIHLNVGDTLILDTRYSPNASPSIANVPNVQSNTSYYTAYTSTNIVASRFDKNNVSWYRHTLIANYDMYVTCCSQSTDLNNSEIRIISGANHNIKQKTIFEQKRQSTFEYLPNEYQSLKTDIEARYNSMRNVWVRKAAKDKQIMIAQVMAMDAEDANNINNQNYTPHLLTQGKCGYMPGSNFDTDPTDFTDDTIHWKLYDNGILYISGYGRMYDFVKGVSGCMTKAQIDSAYPLSGDLWYYNMPENGVEYTYTGEGSVTYQDKKYLEQAYGDATNPLNNKPYGYAAPWYIYRAETDFVEYTTSSGYYARNPQGWYYDRICIVEDTSNGRGGITYIGNWNFYRNTCETLLLPEHVTKIGAWGVRYSTTMKALIMDDVITEIEDHGVSRNESLEFIYFSNNLENVWLNGLQTNYSLYGISLRNPLSEVGKAMLYSSSNLVFAELDGTKNLSTNFLSGISGNSHLLFLSIGEGCVTIEDNSLATNSKLVELTIPSTVTTIESNAFHGNNLRCITIDSPTIAESIAVFPGYNSLGLLFIKAIVVRVKSTITNIGGLEALYSYVGEKDGYNYYVRMTP